MNTYVFQVQLEPDEAGWLVTCPILNEYAAYTWGYTKEEALENIMEVIEMILEELIEDNLPIPVESTQSAAVNSRQQVAVSV